MQSLEAPEVAALHSLTTIVWLHKSHLQWVLSHPTLRDGINDSWTNVAAISAGGYRTCGLRVDGVAVGWGWNDYGQSGPWPEDERFESMSAGSGYPCGLSEGGAAVCWTSDEGD